MRISLSIETVNSLLITLHYFAFTQERVASIRGAAEFLLACGFEDKVLSLEGTITDPR